MILGQRVRVRAGARHSNRSNGTIIRVNLHESLPFLVEHDEPAGDMHNGQGLGKDNHCWLYSREEIQLIGDDDIIGTERVIVIDGKAYRARVLGEKQWTI